MIRFLALSLLAAVPLATQARAQTKVVKSAFGALPDGQQAELYTLSSGKLEVQITTFGAHIVSVMAPGRDGAKTDVVLGYKDLAGFLADDKTYMGSIVGRYGNRIAKGKFSLDGHDFQLSTNDHGNTLHGGKTGFDRANWTGRQILNGVELTLISPDGDMGFPGKLTAHVAYTLTGDKLKIAYTATTDKPTVINLTNHAYFNLAGSGDILNHTLLLAASKLTPVAEGLIPTGDLAPVANTPFDFTHATPIGQRINTPDNQLKIAGGYDHNWVLDGTPTLTKPVAVLTDPASGRTLNVFTTEPGIQFYSGNFLDGTFTGLTGKYNKYSGLCLETQHFPDSPNHPGFPSTTLKPGQTYRTTTIFQFTTAK